MNVLLEGFDGCAEVYKIVNIPQNDRDYYLSFLKALDTFGHYQKTLFSLGVSQNIDK